MKPIFLLLVLVAMGISTYTFSLGWRFHYGRVELDERISRGEQVDAASADAVHALMPSHFVWGMISGVVVCLVHSVVLTYFLGTGKAIKEQTELQSWSDEDYLHWKGLMGRSVIPSSLGILVVCAMAFSGGFTMIRRLSPEGHLLIAGTGLFLQIPIFIMQWGVIRENGKLMDKIVERLGGEDVRIAL